MCRLGESYHSSWTTPRAPVISMSCNSVLSDTAGKEVHVEASDMGSIPDSTSQPADVRCSLETCLQDPARRVHRCCQCAGPHCNTAEQPAAPPALALATGRPSCCAHQPGDQYVNIDRGAIGKAWLFIHASFVRHTGPFPGKQVKRVQVPRSSITK